MKVDFLPIDTSETVLISVLDKRWETYYGNDFINFIMDRVKEQHWIWDADICGDETYYFIVVEEDGKDRLLTIFHEWLIPARTYNDRSNPEDDWNPDYDEYVKNEFYYEYADDPKDIKVYIRRLYELL